MESIKEKSHEIGWVYSKHYGPIACKQEWCEISAREGANYVLEQIEDIIANNEDNTLNMARCLVNCIEQLKK